MNWSVIPDIAAAGFLAIAFASVLNRNGVAGPVRWLVAWLLIVVHFIALLFVPLGGSWTTLANIVSIVALLWAAVFFMWESVPYRGIRSSKYLLISILTATLFHTIFSSIPHASIVILDLSSSLYVIGPLSVLLFAWRQTHPALRLLVVGSYCSLGIFLIFLNHSPHPDWLLAYAPEILVSYLLCSVHLNVIYGRSTVGSFIAISGMYLWASVFLLAPLKATYLPAFTIEGEVWNLPKYIVAVGMILILLENQVKHNRMLALHDELTGLPNRRLFQDRLARSIERARRSGTQTALLMIDLDQFKSVNDTHGHAVGDKLLQYVSRMFEERLRSIDTVARTGGDEFSIILECPILREEAEKVAASLLAGVRGPVALGEHSVQASFSLGIAIFPADAVTAEELYIAADAKMYESKFSVLNSR